MSVLTCPPPVHTPNGANAEPVLHVEPTTVQGVGSRWSEIWLDLVDRAPTCITQHPGYVQRELSSGRSESMRSGHALFAGRDDQWTSAILAPKAVSAKKLGAIGWNRALTGYRLAGSTLLGCESDNQSATQPLRNRIVAGIADVIEAENADFFLIENVETNSATWSVLNDLERQGFHACIPKGIQAYHRSQLGMGEEAYWSSRSKSTRKSYRRLRKSGKDLTVRRFETVDDVQLFLRAANTVSEMSWQSRQLGLRIRNDDRELDLLAFMAEHGAFRSYVLFDGSTPLAFEMDYQFGDTLVSDEAAFDPSFGDRSPGRLLLAHVFDDLFADRTPQWYDFGLGDAIYKRQLATHSTESATVWLFSPGWQRQLTRRMIDAGGHARTLARRALKSTNLSGFVHRWLRRAR